MVRIKRNTTEPARTFRPIRVREKPDAVDIGECIAITLADHTLARYQLINPFHLCITNCGL